MTHANKNSLNAFRWSYILPLLTALVAPADALAAPQLPQSAVNVSEPVVTGKVISVPAGGDFQQALNQALPGDAVELQAGATYVGNFVLPNISNPNGQFIVIRSSQSAQLPAFGTRVSPGYSSAMPKIQSPSNMGAISSADGAGFYYLKGLEVSMVSSATQSTGLLRIGNGSETSMSALAHDIVIDRSYIHCGGTQNCTRGVALNGVREAVVNSYISEIHSDGADAQAIAGWNGAGPFRIENNYLESSGENVMFGGADPLIANLVPSDIEVRGNLMFKPLSWKSDDPSYAGTAWVVKNLFELKNAGRVLIEGNIFQNNWPMAQDGTAVNLKSANQGGTAPWSGTHDVTFRKNLIRNACGGMGISGSDPGLAVNANNIAIENVLFDNIASAAFCVGSTGNAFKIINGPANVEFHHLTVFSPNAGSLMVMDVSAASNFVMRDSIFDHGIYGIKGSGTGDGNSSIQTYFPNGIFSTNVFIGASASLYPTNNFFPATDADVGYVNAAGGNYALASSSPYIGKASDGEDIGVDMVAINSAVAEARSGVMSSVAPVPTPVATPVPTPIPTPVPTPVPMPVATPVPTPTPTPVPSSSAIVLSNLQISNLTSTSVVISWTTNLPSTSQVYYDTTGSYSLKSPLDMTMRTAHSVVIAGLQPSSSYTMLARSYANPATWTNSGDIGRISVQTPAAAPAPASASAVVMSNLQITQITSTSVVISWTTNVPASSQVYYDATGTYSLRTPVDTNLRTSHSVLVTGLKPSTSYTMLARSYANTTTWTNSGDIGRISVRTLATAP